MSAEDDKITYLKNLPNFKRAKVDARHVILKMKKSTQKLEPHPPYRTYGGAVETPLGENRFFYHSARYPTLASALRELNSDDDRSFVTADGRITAIKPGMRIPVIAEPLQLVVNCDEVIVPPNNDPRVQLADLAYRIRRKALENYVGTDEMSLLLAEGTGENLTDQKDGFLG